MADQDILGRVNELVDEEHRLRDVVQRGDLAPSEEQRRLAEVEAQLDQCWDLLRRRRAQREFGGDPGAPSPRPASEVEGYWQ